MTTLFLFSVINVIAILLLYKLRSKPDIILPLFNSSEYLLLFTACSESIYYFLRGVAAIGCLSSRGCNGTPEFTPNHVMAGVFLSYAVIAITNCWVQTMLLLVIRRKRIPTYVSLFLIFLVWFNLAEWLQSAILLGLGRKDKVPSFTPVMNGFYGPYKTRIIILTLLPTMILFRFHTAIVSMELVHKN